MKKTILASAILLAGAANAAEIYNNEGATLSLNGSMRAHIVYTDSSSKKDIKLEESSSRFNIQATQEIDEGVKAFGKIQIKNTGDDNNAYFNDAYVGFASDEMGTIKVGKFIGLNDSLVLNDFTYEGGLYDHEDNLSSFGTTNQGQATKSFGDVTVTVAAANEDTYEFGAVYEAAGLTVGGSYGVANKTTTRATDDSGYIFGAQYNVDALTVGVQYQATDVANKDYKGYGIGAEYTMGQARAYAMYDVTDYDVRADKGSVVTLGADYVLAKGVKTYAEFYSTDSGKAGESTDTKVVVGARVYF